MEQYHLFTKISYLPSDLIVEVNNFIDFLLSKKWKKVKTKRPIYGCAKGTIYMSLDFDEPLEDFKEYM